MARARSALPKTPIQQILRPVSDFIRTGSAGGLVLMAAAAAAVVWANSPAAEGYHHLWATEIGFRVGPWEVSHTLHHWINDGLMAVFFFLVGLEIKREGLVGELASPRKAALPAAAALGGMVVPAALYTLLNAGGDGAPGWGIPMATDIAFALGVLALLGSRVPLSLKVFLTALAIVDDIGAVLVIAVFYTSEIAWGALGAGLALLLAAALCNRLGVRTPVAYVVLGLCSWAFFLASGVHATVSGVLLAFTIPARTRIDAEQFLSHTRDALARFEAACFRGRPVTTNEQQQDAIHDVEDAAEAAQAPLQRIEHELHTVVAFGIIPLFALANAGVALPSAVGASLLHPVTLGIALGLVLGKPLGIVLFSWAAVRAGLATLPEGFRWSQLHAVGWLAGIGFTMSLFISELAFADPAMVDRAKLGTFGASLVAGVAGWILVRRACRPREEAGPEEAAGIVPAGA
jgi:NhaA family Na+:H+ antiporter